MNEIEKRVQDSAKFYTESYLNIDLLINKYCFETIKPMFKGDLCLELGPSSGYMTKSLIKEFKTVHLLDAVKELLDQIPDYDNVVKFHSMFEDFTTEVKYDTIVMSCVLEHISDPVGVLSRVKDWLKPGGSFIISVPNAKSLHRLVAVEMGLLKSGYELNQRDHELGHYRVYDSDLLQKHVTDSGLKVVKKGGFFLKALSNAQMVDTWSPELLEGFFKVGHLFEDNCAEVYVVCTVE